jgi:hypothetical protein
MTALARAAVAYARLGIEVFPLTPREKQPYGYTRGLLDASEAPDLAAARWAGQADLPLRPPKKPGERMPARVRAGPLANVGIATGPGSGFWVLDTDGDDAEAALQALVDVHSPLPETPEQATGNGRHRCFAWDPAFPIRNSQAKIGPHIDVRGDGGYIVAPPSVHPSGRIYAWSPGRSPHDLPFARAPEWLSRLAMPAEAPAPAAASRPARQAEQGRASRFGEAVLATACRMIATAPAGKQQGNLWGYACQIGGYVAGGEIDTDYARRALIDAGERMAPAGKPWLRKEIESHVDRGLEHGGRHPREATPLRTFQPAGRRAPPSAAPSAAAQAVDIRDARALWDSARPADCALVRSWFKARGLDAEALPGALGRLRAAQRAPLEGGATGPALLLPLFGDPDALAFGDAVDAVAVLPLLQDRIARLLGQPAGRVAFLTDPPPDGALLVALDLQDAWTLGVNAHENGHELGVVLAPTVKAFAGGALGDRWGRMDPQTPYADPEAPPWTLPGERAVFLAVRADLRTPELKSRRTFGTTGRARLEGEAAARFYGGLAEQAWRRAGANQVRILRPSGGAGGFNVQRMAGAA